MVSNRRKTTRRPTIEQLVYQDKVILDGLFVEFAKIRLSVGHKLVQELEQKRSIGIALCDGDEKDVFVLDVAECRRPERQDRRPHERV